MTRLIRVSDDIFDRLDLRTSEGQALTASWGEPDADGIYEPTLAAIDDGMTVVPRAQWDRLQQVVRTARLVCPSRTTFDSRWAPALMDALYGEEPER